MATYRFTGPTRQVVDAPFTEPDAPWGPRMPRLEGLNVYRLAGVWHAEVAVSEQDRLAADRFYLGGHVHTVDQAAADELTAAGYGAYLSLV